MNKFVILTLSVFVVKVFFAQIHHVPEAYPTIQSGLYAATSGDTVLVQPGTYFENIVWPETEGIKLLAAETPENTIIDGEYSGCVISFDWYQGYDTTTQIKGFTITHGSESGIYLNEASIKIENTTITENTGYQFYDGQIGGGIRCYYSSPLIVGSIISENSVSGLAAYGGGVFCSSYSSPVFYNVDISDNTCTASTYACGGGVYLENHCESVFENVVISNNTLEGETCQGGGIYAYIFSVPFLLKSRVMNNRLNGTEDNYGGGIYYFTNSTMIMDQSYIMYNQFSGTATSNYGIGIFCLNSSMVITNSLIASNFISGGISGFDGGGIHLALCDYMDTTEIVNSTIANNYRINNLPIQGSGLHCVSSNVSVLNSVFWNENNADEIEMDVVSHVDISHSNIRDGWPGYGNIVDDPQFVNDSTFSLLLTSPCLNAGTLEDAPEVDIEGNPRPLPVYTNPDMGAYEMDQLVSIHSKKIMGELCIRPNPISNTLVLSFCGTENTIVDIMIFRSDGILIKEINNINGSYITLNVKDFSPGLYIVKLKDRKGKNIITKFVKGQ